MSASPKYNSPVAQLGLREDEMARRRLQQKGDIRSKNGWWRLRWRIDTIDEKGNRKRTWSETKLIGPAKGNPISKPMTEKEARREAWERYLSRLDQNAVAPQSTASVAEFVDRKFRPEHMMGLRPHVKKTYEGLLGNHILPVIGKLRLMDVRRDHCQTVVQLVLSRKLSVQTAYHVRNVMSAVFSLAEDSEWLCTGNPARRVRLPKLQHRERRALTWDQVEQLAELVGPRYAPLIRFLARTGVRISEACGLRWKWVNLTDKTVYRDGEPIPEFSFAIRDCFSNGRWSPAPKTKAGQRIVPLTSHTWVLLGEILETTAFCAPEHTVFVNRTGGPVDSHNLSNRKIRPAAKAMGMSSSLCLHSLRHTAATLADQAGVTLAERNRLLGHARGDIGLRYTHADGEQIRKKLETIQ